MGLLAGFLDAIKSSLGSLSAISPLRLLEAIVVLVGFVLLARFLGKVTLAWGRRTLPDNVARALSKAVYYTLIFLGIVAALGTYGVNLSSLLVAGGIAGIVVGFASQTVFSNLLSGLFIYFDRPFLVGDPIEVEGIGGVVSDIGVFSTKVISWDGVLHRLPNERIFNATIKNFSRMVARRVEYLVSIGYGDDIEKARRVIMKVIEEEPLALAEPEPQVFVSELGDNGVILTVRFWAPTPKWFDAKMRVLGKIKEALDEAGIEIPFPQSSVWFRNPLKLVVEGEARGGQLGYSSKKEG